MKILIYELSNKSTGKTFYVGQTEDLQSRFTSHIFAAINDEGNGSLRRKRNQYIRDCLSDICISVVAVVEDDGSGKQSIEAEQKRYDELVGQGRTLMQFRPGTPKKRLPQTELEKTLDRVLEDFDTFCRERK